MLRRLQQPESCLSAFCWIVLVGWLDSGAVNASRCAGHHQLPTSHPLVVPCTIVQCVAGVEGARSVHEVVDNPDFLIKSHSVDHKSGHLPSLYPSPLLFIQCHKIVLNVYAVSQTWLDLLCPTSNSSASFPCLRFSSDPLSRPGLSSWALIGQDATCSSLLIGREANPSVTASKARARPHSRSQQDSCVITKIQITRSKLAML